MDPPEHRIPPGLGVALLVAAAATAWPFFAGEWLPLLDLPQHAASVTILAGGPPSWNLAPYYTWDLSGSPYLLAYLSGSWLARLLGAVDAVRLLFALAAAALPLAAASAARAFGRDPRIGLLAAPLAFNTFLFMGFLNFVLALPLLLLYLGWWRRRAGAPAFGPGAWIAGAAWGAALYYGHVLIFAFAVGAAGLAAILGGPLRREAGIPGLGARLLRLAHLLPGTLLFSTWLFGSDVASKGELGRMIGGSMAAEAPHWLAPTELLKALPDWFLDAWHGPADEQLLFAWIAVFGLLCLLRRSPPAAPRPVIDHLPPWLLLTALALVVALPHSYRGIYPIGLRLLPVAALLALLVPRGPLLLPRLSTLLALALVLVSARTHAERVARFQEEVGDFEAALEAIPEGARTLALIHDPNSRIARQPVFLHFGQYALARKGGVAELSFLNFTKSPIQYVEAQAPPRFPARFEWTPQRFDYDATGRYFDRFVVRSPRPIPEARLFGRHHDELELLRRAGTWGVYAREPSGPPEPSVP